MTLVGPGERMLVGPRNCGQLPPAAVIAGRPPEKDYRSLDSLFLIRVSPNILATSPTSRKYQWLTKPSSPTESTYVGGTATLKGHCSSKSSESCRPHPRLGQCRLPFGKNVLKQLKDRVRRVPAMKGSACRGMRPGRELRWIRLSDKARKPRRSIGVAQPERKIP